MRRIMTAAVLTLALAACGGSDDGDDQAEATTTTAEEAEETTSTTAERTTTTEAPTTTAAPDAADDGCIEVTNARLLEALGIEGAWAFAAGEEGRWFVATSTGATWYSYWDPADPDDPDRTLMAPLNEVARETSDFGSAAEDGAPVYEGATDGDAGAVRARDCATT